MTSDGDILLRASDLLRWQEEERQLENDIRELLQRQADVRRKLEAAAVFAVSLPKSPVEEAPKTTGQFEIQDDSIPSLLAANLRETGDALTVSQIRQRLIDLGFGEKVRSHPNYHYATAHRLVKQGRLLKRGSLYEALPSQLGAPRD